MGEAHLAKDRRETVSFLGGSWRRMRTKTEAAKSIGEGMLRRIGGVWRTRGLEILLRQICCSPSRWVSEGLPRSCCMLHAAKHGRGYRRDKGPLSVDWWLASFVPFLAAALSEPSQPRVPGTLGARSTATAYISVTSPLSATREKHTGTQAQRTATALHSGCTSHATFCCCILHDFAFLAPSTDSTDSSSPVPSTTSVRCPPSPSPRPIPSLGLPGIIVASPLHGLNCQ
jgi:hypothetical protein